MPEERMSEEDFNYISVKSNALSLYAVSCLITEAKRAREQEEKWKRLYEKVSIFRGKYAREIDKLKEKITNEN